MAPINGQPFLEHQLAYWIEQGINSFILAVGYRYQIIKLHFGDRFKDASIMYSIEDKPLGTGGALFLALEKVQDDSPFLILNGDTFFEVNLQELVSFHDTKRAELTVALKEVQVNERYNCVKIRSDGRVVSFDERTVISGHSVINGGVYLTKKSVFDNVRTRIIKHLSLENQVFPRLLQDDKRLFGHVSHGRFIDIGVPEDYRKATDVLRHF
jgi:D-glycero-alpha-D-manno-heptose 1-phosphate guanylyltransferase